MFKKSLIFASAAIIAGVTAFAAEEIHIGALVPEKGSLATEGKLVKTALGLAEKNINEGLRQKDEYKVSVTCEGTDPDTPSTALDKLKALKEKGINIVIGPATDAEVSAVKEFADKEKMILISYGCTSMDYAIADDNIFRILPDDNSTSGALSVQMAADKIAAVIILEKGDSFGKALGCALKEKIGKAKYETIEEVTFAPDLKNIDSVLSELEKKIAEASKKYGEGKVAVVLVTASGSLCQGASCGNVDSIKCESLNIVKEASKVQGLANARWYLASIPGEKFGSAAKEDKELIGFLIKSKLTFPVAAVNETDTYLELCVELKKAAPGESLSAYSFAAYDALELAVDISRNCMASGRAEFRCLKEDLCSRSRFSHGLTGFNALNEKGDKVADDVNFMQLKASGSSFEWVPVSRFFCSGGTCVPLDDAKPELPKGIPLMENKMFPVK